MDINKINNLKNTAFKGNNAQAYNYNLNQPIQDEYNFSTSQKSKPKKKGKIAVFLLAAILSAAIAGNKGDSDSKKVYENIGTSPISLSDFDEEYVNKLINSNNISEDLAEIAQKNENLTKIPIIGKMLYENKGLENIDRSIASEGNEINGYIDNPISQGVVSDCWLITPVENLAYTKEGAKIIHDAISQDENGNINVYLKGPDLTYTITPEEIEKGNKEYSVYSRGDDDMLVLELAVEKFRKDLLDNKIEIDESLPDYLYKTNDNGYNPIRRGETRQAYWLLAGITDGIEAKTEEEIDDVLNKYAENPETSFLDVELKETVKVKDVNGESGIIYASHGYGVKNMTKDTITLVSASYTTKEITLPLSELKKLPLDCFVYCSLNQNN